MKQAKIYTAPNCSWCHKAKTLMQEHKLPYTECILGVDMPRDDFISFMQSVGMKGVPIIYIDDKLVGGFVQLKELLEPETKQIEADL